MQICFMLMLGSGLSFIGMCVYLGIKSKNVDRELNGNADSGKIIDFDL